MPPVMNNPYFCNICLESSFFLAITLLSYDLCMVTKGFELGRYVLSQKVFYYWFLPSEVPFIGMSI